MLLHVSVGRWSADTVCT